MDDSQYQSQYRAMTLTAGSNQMSIWAIVVGSSTPHLKLIGYDRHNCHCCNNYRDRGYPSYSPEKAKRKSAKS